MSARQATRAARAKARTEVAVCTPLLVERLAVGRVPGARVVRTGMGPGAPRPEVPTLVAGVAGSLSAGIQPGDVVVASEVRGPGGRVPVSGAPALAAALRRLGLRTQLGPIVSVRRPVDGRARRELAATGAVAVDMESAFLAPAERPFAVVRTIVDTFDHPLWSLGTVWRGVRALRALRRAVPAIAWWATTARPDSATARLDRDRQAEDDTQIIRAREVT